MTAPSYSNDTLLALAKALSAWACKAIGPLLVVTTCLPASSAQRQKVAAGSPSLGLVNVASAMMSAPDCLITASLNASAEP
ncbi:hypothetical protein D9M68_933030 [compost metagenome]